LKLLFRKQNIVAELKCLVLDQAGKLDLAGPGGAR
jgi:hypothetical protein